MSREIERKFRLAAAPAWLDDHDCEPIEQGYLVSEGERVEVRLRRSGGRASLTVKSLGGLNRAEVVLDLEPSQVETLWPLTEGRRITKRRHRVSGERLPVEVDVYAGGLEGLVVAEVEFGSEAEANRFEPAGWLGREVTGDERFANRKLASDGLPEEEDEQ
ncbi:MAG: adenylate cyclase [Solirubrobacterales bacterium]|nr:adenylate cyclase [Solirubrobacterales bacterium]